MEEQNDSSEEGPVLKWVAQNMLLIITSEEKSGVKKIALLVSQFKSNFLTTSC